jgi:hypothetical protein
VTLDQYCGIKYRGRTRSYHRGNNELECRARKMEIPTFDGSARTIAQAWVHKLDAYLQLKPMKELDDIKFSTIYLEGKAHDWWYHGMNTLGHNHITSYPEFTQRLIDRFDQGDHELHFCELTQLRQTGSPETFIEEFQRVVIMVPDVSQARLLIFFSKGLMEPLCGWVKAFKPHNLQEAIWRTRDLMGSAAKTKFTPRPPLTQGVKDQRGMDKGKGRMDEATRRELRRKQLCFTCKES